MSIKPDCCSSKYIHSVPSNHPLRKALWIWPEATMYLYNHYAQFRYDFELMEVPVTAPLFITADKEYRLYINGIYICRGPARGYQSHWPFDEIDLKPYLRTGHNWVSVEAYNPGIGTYQYVHCSRAGLLAAAEWGNFALYSDPEHWKMRRNPAYNCRTARLSAQMNFQEDFDSARDDRTWITAESSNLSWSPNLFPAGTRNVDRTEFGRPPYEDVEPRGIPLLREEIILPQCIVSSTNGKCCGDYRNSENISWHWLEQEFATCQWQSANDSIPDIADQFPITIPACGEGNFSAVTIDFGKIEVGTAIIKIENATGHEIIELHYFQCLRQGIPIPIPKGKASLLGLANRWRLTSGQQSHEFFHPIAARHIVIVVRNSDIHLRLHAALRTAVYPLTHAGQFFCSDLQLNRIHTICRHTQQICSLDAFVDTPWREQAQWWGDARVQAKNIFYLDGDTRLLVRGIRSIAGQSTPNGLTLGHAPTCSGFVLPDFSLTWIMTIWDYYWQTGDISLFLEQQDKIKQILDYFAHPEQIGPIELLHNDSRYWLFEDWASLPKNGMPTFLNLWYIYTLTHYVKLLKVAGHTAEGKKTIALIHQRRQAIEQHLFQLDMPGMIPGINMDGTPTGQPSIHDQVLAILLDIHPEFHQAIYEKHIAPWINGAKMPGAVPSVFWMTYLFDALDKLNHDEDIIRLIRHYWTPMLETGATWEETQWHETASTSCSHGWSAHPASHLVNIVAGIKQTAPGWREIIVSPYLDPEITTVDTIIPTPLGSLEMKLRYKNRFGCLTLRLPLGIKAQIILPGISCKKKITGTNTINFKV